jgi:arsenite methyltransferase
MAGLRTRFQAQLARQLGHPSGLAGRVVARGLNRGNKRLITEVVQALTPSARATVADIGFGGGLGLELLLKAADDTVVHGIEVSSSMIRRAQTRFGDELSSGRLHLHLASVAQLPLGDASLDGAITVNTLYFVSDLDRAFDEVARVLRRSGRLVIGIGDPEAMSELAFAAHGFRLRAVEEISDALSSAGLTVVDHRRNRDSRIQSHILIAHPAEAPLHHRQQRRAPPTRRASTTSDPSVRCRALQPLWTSSTLAASGP